MGIEDRFGQAARLEEREAEQHRIGSNLEDAGVDVFREDDALNQNRVNRHTYHHEEALKTQSRQIADIVVAHLTPFSVGQGSKRDWRNRAGQEDFNHATV